MTYRKKMSDNSKCEGCSRCKHYPYFHYVSDEKGEDIEYIKFDNNNSKLINHTKGIIFIYNGFKWRKQFTKPIF